MAQYTHYTLAATELVNGGIELYRGMYSRSTAAETPELAKILARPHKRSGPTVLTRVETADALPGRRLIRETILEVLPDPV